MSKQLAAEFAMKKLAETLDMRFDIQRTLPHLFQADLDEGDDEWRYRARIKMTPLVDEIIVSRDLYGQRVDEPLTNLLRALYQFYLSNPPIQGEDQ